MLTIDCPWCTGPATMTDALVALECEACDVHVDLAPDPTPGTIDSIAA